MVEVVDGEHAIGTLMAALDGANLIHDIGYLGQGLLGNPAAIVMGDEIVSCRRTRAANSTRSPPGLPGRWRTSSSWPDGQVPDN